MQKLSVHVLLQFIYVFHLQVLTVSISVCCFMGKGKSFVSVRSGLLSILCFHDALCD